jgi:hypothetical protein
MGEILVPNIENDIQDRSSFWLREATAMIDFVRPNTRSFEDLGARKLILHLFLRHRLELEDILNGLFGPFFRDGPCLTKAFFTIEGSP